jgi:hypothetical protein
MNGAQFLKREVGGENEKFDSSFDVLHDCFEFADR